MISILWNVSHGALMSDNCCLEIWWWMRLAEIVADVIAYCWQWYRLWVNVFASCYQPNLFLFVSDSAVPYMSSKNVVKWSWHLVPKPQCPLFHGNIRDTRELFVFHVLNTMYNEILCIWTAASYTVSWSTNFMKYKIRTQSRAPWKSVLACRISISHY